MKILILVFCLMFVSINGFCSTYEVENLFLEHHQQHKVVKKKVCRVTGYTASRKENGGHSLTANNKKLKRGYIAVSPDLLKSGWKFGEKVYIKEIGIFEIQDTMAKRKKNSMDIFFHGKNEAEDFGVKQLEVILLATNN